jgi:hypothetical protein
MVRAVSSSSGGICRYPAEADPAPRPPQRGGAARRIEQTTARPIAEISMDPEPIIPEPQLPSAPASSRKAETRRHFGARMLRSLITYGLLEALWCRGLLAEGPAAIGRWFTELAELAGDLKGGKLSDVQFQERMEEVYRRVDLVELIRAVKLEDLERSARLPANGAISLGFDLSRLEGAPGRVGFGKQIFGLRKGRSIVPHGHRNMCTGFIVLKGTFRGRHWDRVETHDDHYLIRPTIDRTFKPGDLSTISDHRDNIHWFEALTEPGFVFNLHVIGYDPALEGAPGRLYLDPDGEKVGNGLIRARKLTVTESHQKYG